MEKAMSQSHQLNYKEYESKISNQLKVEQRREKEYQATKQMYADIENHTQK